MKNQKFWQEIHKELDAFIQKRVRNTEDVFDLRQEILLRIHNNIDSLLKAEKIKSWIYQIARNAIIDFYRKQKPTAALPENLALLYRQLQNDIPKTADHRLQTAFVYLFPLSVVCCLLSVV